MYAKYTLCSVFVIVTRRVLGENLSEKKKWVATSTKEFLGEKSPKLATYSKKKKKKEEEKIAIFRL
jgi:hypothetical protein